MDSILVVDDEKTILHLLASVLRQQGYKVDTAENGTEAIGLLKNKEFDIVVTDVVMDEVSGIELLQFITSKSPATCVILITAHESTSLAVRALKAGAFDLATKPLNPRELLSIIQRAIEYRTIAQGIMTDSEPVTSKFEDIFDTSEQMKEIRETVQQFAHTDVPVLIKGEHGTPKIQLARQIHNLGTRRERAFSVLECKQKPQDITELVLYGAKNCPAETLMERARDVCDNANGGTICIDAIEALPPRCQEDLCEHLGVVKKPSREQTSMEAVNYHLNARLLATTSNSLKDEVESGRFRRDLYRRLNVVTIAIPPLRNRKKGILSLANYYLSLHAQEGRKIPKLNIAAQTLLESYPWPGNDRELESAMTGAIETGKAMTTENDLPPLILASLGSEELKREAEKKLEQYRGQSLRAFLAKSNP